MNILYLCHRFPFPPVRGGKIRPFNVIRHLAGSGHHVQVVSLARTALEAQEGQGIAAYCADFNVSVVNESLQWVRMIARLPTSVPSSMGYFYSRNMAATVNRLLEKKSWDLIFVHCSSVAQYVQDVRNIPKLLDFGDMDSQKWLEYANYKPWPLSVGYQFEGLKMLAAEKRLAQQFDLCTTTTKSEWQTLNDYRTGAQTDWFPNGVDIDYFCPEGGLYDPETISFIGRMDYYPNQQCMAYFCREIWPIIKSKRAGMKLLIVGADPSPEMKALGELPGVKVTGSVPDVRPYVRGSALMVAPLSIARGTQNKILEAMAMGVPVVTSSIAAGGVDAVAGVHLQTADAPEGVANAVMGIVENPSERARLAQSGRDRMLSNHSWGRSMQRLECIIEDCLAAHLHRHPSPKYKSL